MTQAIATQDKAKTLKNLLSTARVEILAALPKHITPDRMLRLAMTCARVNPQLLDCTPESFLGAVIQSAQLGLEPGHSLGHAYLIPFKNSQTGKKEVQFLCGYRGLMDLVYRAPDHPNLMPQAVYESDIFTYQLGTEQFINHKPAYRKEKEKLVFVYCVATFPGGRKEFIVMSRPDIDDVRLRSKSAGSSYSPWSTDYEAMALKTVIRRICKYLPTTIEMKRAITLDELADRGESQRNEDFLIPESTPIQTKSERVGDKVKELDSDPESFENFK